MFVNISFLPSLFSREGSTEGSLGRWAGGQGGWEEEPKAREKGYEDVRTFHPSSRTSELHSKRI